MRTKCRFELQPEEDYLVQIDAQVFILYQSEMAPVDLTCGLTAGVITKKREVRFQGVRKITVPSSCRVETRSFVFDGMQLVVIAARPIESRLMNISKWVDPDLINEIHKMTAETLHDFSLIGNTKGLTVRDIASDLRARNVTTYWRIGLGTLFLVAIGLIAVLCLLRFRHFLKGVGRKKRKPAEEQRAPWSYRSAADREEEEERRELEPGIIRAPDVELSDMSTRS
jgi:hypothetical protein